MKTGETVKNEPDEGDDSMTYDELFCGEEVWLSPKGDPGWLIPWLTLDDWVEMEVQPKDLDPLETPHVNFTCHADPAREAAFSQHDGWPAFAIAIQYIGELLSFGSEDGINLLEAEERVVRDDQWNVTGRHYRVLWKGEEVEGF
jgi:hypothetical protein